MGKRIRTFRVYVQQVNQTWVDVRAADEDEAAEKGYRKWRRTEGHSSVSSVDEQPEGEE